MNVMENGAIRGLRRLHHSGRIYYFRLLDKIDQTQVEGNFAILPLLQQENATVMKWQEFLTVRADHQ